MPTPLSNTRSLVYALPVVASAGLVISVSTVVPGLYSRDHGMALAVVGFWVMAVRTLDAAIDPVAGYLADVSRRWRGSRKLWVAAGMLLMISSAAWLYLPPEGASTAHFATGFLFFYIGWTVFEIPHSAWGAELAQDHVQRSRLYSLRAGATIAGCLLFFLIPFLPFLPSTEFTREMLAWTVVVIGGFGLLTTAMLCRALPDPGGASLPPSSPRVALRSVWRNRPLRIFLLAYLVAGLGFGLWGGLLFLALSTGFGLESRIALIFVISMAGTLVAVPLYARMLLWLGKARAWALSTLALAAATLMPVFFDLGAEDLFIPVLISIALGYVLGSCQSVAAPALLGDIADYGRFRFGTDCTSSYFAVFSFSVKAVTGFGAGVSLSLAAWLGFDPTAATLDARGSRALMLAFAVIPSAIALISVPLILWIPLSARQHAVIMRRMARRAVRSACATPS